MQYEEQLKKWAEKKYGIPADKILEISLSSWIFDNGSGCPTCDYGHEVYNEINLHIKWQRIASKKDKFFESFKADFAELLQEIIEA